MAAKGSLPSSDQGRDGGTERHWWTLIAVCGATFMLLVDITIVQVALPTMQRSLHASFSDLQWVISAYALSLSALILTQGALADRFGRKRIFIIGLTVFTLASLACGLAHSPARAHRGPGRAGGRGARPCSPPRWRSSARTSRARPGRRPSRCGGPRWAGRSPSGRSWAGPSRAPSDGSGSST